MEFQELLALKIIENLTPTEQIDVIGNLFDLSYDNNSLIGIEHAFNLSKQINTKALEDEDITILNYDLSNGWSYLRHIKYGNTEGDWNFQMDELTKEIIHLRTAIASPGFEKIKKERQCQIYTNLANSFSYIGRFVEAQEYWNKAITILENFSMAIGNKANGLFHYGRILFDNTHRNLFLVYAYHHLGRALSLRKYLDEHAEKGMQELHKLLNNSFIKKLPEEYAKGFPDLNTYDLGEDVPLRDYRQWCLTNKLFINPVNDLGNYTMASHDCLNLPTLIIKANKPPASLNLYNQIKQEFATARYSYYVSISGQNPHFSDFDVPLVETMETVRYSYYIEQIKIAFRLAYSILDKIAFLLNDYLNLGIEAHKISFRSLWYSHSQKMALRPLFINSDNWSLRGLYWLSKDLYEKDKAFDAVLEPDAQEIVAIRNFIEHKGFKVLSDFRIFDNHFDISDISYTISRNDFEKKTLNLLKLTRAAIMYLALAISHEENKKDYSETKAMPVPGGIIPNYMKL